MQRAAEIAIYFSHTRPDGEICWTAYTDAGYSYNAAAENYYDVGVKSTHG